MVNSALPPPLRPAPNVAPHTARIQSFTDFDHLCPPISITGGCFHSEPPSDKEGSDWGGKNQRSWRPGACLVVSISVSSRGSTFVLATAVTRPQGWAAAKPWRRPRTCVTVPHQQQGEEKKERKQHRAQNNATISECFLRLIYQTMLISWPGLFYY